MTTPKHTPKQTPKMRSRIVSINPKTALRYLETVDANRKISDKNVSDFVGMMRRGEFYCSPQGIVIDINGRLIDGQHRLWAVVETEGTYDFYVTENCDPTVFKVLDSGKKRTASDGISIAGYKDANLLASAIRVVNSWTNAPNNSWTAGQSTITTEQALNLLADHPDIEDHKTVAHQVRIKLSCSPAVALAAVYMIHHEGDEGSATDFFEGLVSGVGLQAGDPRLVLDDRFRRLQIAARTARQNVRDTREQAMYIVKAYNAFIAGRSIQKLQNRRDEAFPAISGAARSQARRVA
jgi:hypothetical protein